MSSLLEQAIVDATALKEAALKNAENLVIEKYSEEVRQAMKSLLEEEEDPFAAETEDPFAIADPSGEEGLAIDDMGVTGAPLPEITPEPGLEEEPAEEEFADTTLGSIPDAFDPDLGDPEDEIINIKLDSLRADLPEEAPEGPFAGGMQIGDDEIGIDISDDSDEEVELDFDDETEADVGIEPSVTSEPDLDIGISPEMVAEALSEMNLEEEIDVEEVLEAVRVDFEPQKSGWAGTPEPQMREYESMLLAREQDTKVKEENEELRKTVAGLQKENKILASAAQKLKLQNEKFTTALETLQEKLETVNVSNAKLLYINRALENTSLNERQKEKIVEAISKATTIQEAKIVFDTLQETISSTPAEKRLNSLSEAVSRRSTLLVSARKEQKEREASPAFERMQRLAGIKLNK